VGLIELVIAQDNGIYVGTNHSRHFTSECLQRILAAWTRPEIQYSLV